MAEFVFKRLRYGSEDKELSYALSLVGINFEPDDVVVEIPESYNGEPVKNIAIEESYLSPQPRYHDWHHPTQGIDGYDPGEYSLKESYWFYYGDKSKLKKVIFPASATWISLKAVNDNRPAGVSIRISPDNPRYEIKRNKMIKKKSQ